MFADEQIVGPYRHWFHRHPFRKIPGGVAIEDEVEYQLPFGALGRFAHAAFVRRQLGQIFDYRTHVIAARFPLQPDRSDDRVRPIRPDSPSGRSCASG